MTEIVKPDWFMTVLLCVVTGLVVHALDTQDQKTHEKTLLQVVTEQHAEDVKAFKTLTDAVVELGKRTGHPIGNPQGSHE